MKIIFSILLFIAPITVFSQEVEDSLKTLDEVLIKAFEQNTRRSSVARVVEFNNADRDNKTSLVREFNGIAGVRMEERSPGSYRINIRGSSLRSPFGVRNVKVYWNDLPLTDAGGNTYFNQLAWNNFSYIEIFKGPAASMYGAGTGGLILLHNLDRWQPGISLEYVTGSYELHNIFGSARFGSKTNRNQLTYAHNQSDGYREQSVMRRDNFSWHSVLKLSDKQELGASLLFTDMEYETPGALTLSEFNKDPRAARPAAGGFPSAVIARAAIYQQNLLAGFTNTYTLKNNWKNTTNLYGMYNQVKNPAIRNYERRKEPGFGGRTVFSYLKKSDTGNSGQLPNQFQFVAGSEFSEGFYNNRVSKNVNGQPDSLQTDDDIRNSNYGFFAQGDISFREKWLITGGISMNFSKVKFTRLSIYPVTEQEKKYRNEIAPRVNIQRKWDNRHSIGVSISRGYSPPTVAELLPSTSILNTELEAEQGWNYELLATTALLKNRLWLSLNAYYFRLEKALVQRRDLSGADFFVNAGNTKQKGLEFNGRYSLVSIRGFIDQLHLNLSYTFQHFRYGSFLKGNDDFSGKTIPSVPSQIISFFSDIYLDKGIYLQLNYYQASKIFLNDANTFSADAYHLLGARAGWKRPGFKKHRLSFYFGADNLLKEKYSLGNDINAPAGRFFNAAPGRNYYAGASWQFVKS